MTLILVVYCLLNIHCLITEYSVMILLYSSSDDLEGCLFGSASFSANHKPSLPVAATLSGQCLLSLLLLLLLAVVIHCSLTVCECVWFLCSSGVL